ncbi:hypothetical protein NCU08256 [Neurospora crassa OR74A]|uniref:Uncharacterized protein n=1 Tax=Neurospora crassa (strain ATCC 24698 / 74-OR23-1A / CBS 708.71 / DSM 1257 / FGSC 987) TaxID=367110 RepID=Q7S3I7_NEUCR|nr:hypothetical protein NCU08256 [Neurospora crassa OR74A]EAA30110.2 hypothetical protein NCU08256 [Neurospora crassa OR74A]|eukprot:XP_959346.2 hypothetical protein NCU08256 [Neurospora crassa OR74A]
MGIVEAPLAVLAHSPLRAEHAIGACSQPHQPISLHGLTLSRARAVRQAFLALPGPTLLDGAQMALAARRNRLRKGARRIGGENEAIKGVRQVLDYRLVLEVLAGHWDRRRGGGGGVGLG